MDWPSQHSILAIARPDGSRRGGEDRKAPTSTADAADFCDSGHLGVPTAKDFVNSREHACRPGLRRQPTNTTPWRRSRQTAGWDCSTKSRAGTVPRQLIIPLYAVYAASGFQHNSWNATSRTEHPSALCPSRPESKGSGNQYVWPAAGTGATKPPDASADPRERIASLTLPGTPFYGGHVIANLRADGSETDPSIALKTSISGISVAPLSPIWRASNISRAH